MRTMKMLMLAAALLLAVPAESQDLVTYQALTISSSAVGLATATTDPSGRGPIARCTARLEDAAVRYRFDRTNPTATEGHLLNPQETLEIDSHNVAVSIRFIRTAATDGVLRVSCWR